MKRFSLVAGVTATLATVVLLLAAGAAGASSGPAQRSTFSHYWNYTTGIGYDTSKVDVCPAFPGGVFFDVSLTANYAITVIPVNAPLVRLAGVGTVSGVINAPDGTYTLTGGPFVENRFDDVSFSDIFIGSGRLTISGPDGTVAGLASFADVTGDNGGMGFQFTRVTTCHLS